MLFHSNILSLALTVAVCSSSVASCLPAMDVPRDTAAVAKTCTGNARFPPLSPTLGNLTTAQADQYTVIDTALTKFYGGTGAVVKNADGSFAGPFGQLMYTTPAIVQNFINLNVGVAQNLVASENEACVLGILSVITAPFAVYLHTILAEKAGLTATQVNSMLAGKCPTTLTARQAAAYKLAVKIAALKGPLDLASFKDAEAVLGTIGVEGVTQQTATSMLAIVMLNVGDICVPAGV